MKIKVRVADVQIEYDGETNMSTEPVIASAERREALHKTITHMAEQAHKLLKKENIDYAE